MNDTFRYRGLFLGEVWERRKSGLLALVRHWTTDPGLIAENGITDAGIADNEQVYFAGGTQKPLWYILLVNNVGFSGFAAGDTMAAHAGWAEFTGYNESTRQQWLAGTPAGRVITGTASAAFTSTAGSTVYGAGLVSNNTKGGTTGVLWSTGPFGSPQVLSPSQVLRVNYTLTGASS